jgi:hypothetical protein
MMSRDETFDLDPRGLIADAYAINGIELAECRTIFLDWVLGLDDSIDPLVAISALRDKYAHEGGHPMTTILAEGTTSSARPKRKRVRS